MSNLGPLRPITLPSRVRIRVKIERFVLQEDERHYLSETQRETLLETSADPTESNIEMIRQQVGHCLAGYRPEPFIEGEPT